MRYLAPLLVAALALVWAADLPLIQPRDLAAEMRAKGPVPMVIHVGFNVLYRGKHIPGSIYAGPGSRPEGLEALRTVVGRLPRDREIVLYCGCCPWDHCPNVKPAMELLRTMGFTHAKVMFVPTNFKADWIDRGFPVEEGQAAR
jgi:hypothetical protein